jgi:hypothetical protein
MPDVVDLLPGETDLAERVRVSRKQVRWCHLEPIEQPFPDGRGRRRGELLVDQRDDEPLERVARRVELQPAVSLDQRGETFVPGQMRVWVPRLRGCRAGVVGAGGHRLRLRAVGT